MTKKWRYCPRCGRKESVTLIFEDIKGEWLVCEECDAEIYVSYSPISESARIRLEECE